MLPSYRDFSQYTASEMREKGMSFDEVAVTIQTCPARLNGVFTVGNLVYCKNRQIKRNHCFGWLHASLKPILRGSKDGYIVQFRKCRGRKAVLNELVNLLCNNITDPENQIIGVAHADAYEDSLYVIEQIKKRIKVRDVINTTYDFCTGSHVGW